MNPAGEVNWGQDVGITCSISTQLLGGTFILQKTSGSFRQTQTSSNNSATFNIPKVNFDNEGSYQCQYEKRTESQTFRSDLSDSVRVSVTVSFPKPNISMNPAGEVNWGQDVGITCSVSTQLLGGTFILQKTSGSFRENQTSSNNSATFNVHRVDFDKEGLYQCQYQTMISGLDFSSPLSNSARLSISVWLQKPSISLTSPDGGLVLSPEAAQVTRSSSFIITCSINSRFPDGHFFLIFSGSSVTSKSAVDHSASFNFPVAEYKHQGNYSCVYEVTLSTRKFNSTETESISVTIKLPFLQLLSSVAAGSLLLLLSVLFLVIGLVCRRKRRERERANQPRTRVSSKVAVEDDEDDSEDYVNVIHMKSMMKLKKGRMEKEEESDEDDYVEMSPTQEVGLSVRQQRAKGIYGVNSIYENI
uniref:Ig-like domain-containing protein n=1 Tax=Anabas testudineus TaxID=64144 RepID=A0AAQ6IMP4_ANATE